MPGSVRLLSCLVLVVIVPLLVSCAQTPSPDEAKKTVDAYFRSTGAQFVSIDTKAHTECGLAIHELINEGYLSASGEEAEGAKRLVHLPTEKAKPFLKEAVWTVDPGQNINQWHLEGAVVRKVVKEIREISPGPSGSGAVVALTVGYEPIEPFFTKLCDTGKCTDSSGRACSDLKGQTEQQKVELRKTGAGWSVE